ncbi:MAG: M3 family metallopeptidase [Deltaproteobacteria bacterium]|nr:M3 family metallopeptidase [Deltaproteobacteria bacterium]MBW2414978.1 M3 family metallopeptidase [Deltaproteobacteria bacterium]
MRALLADLEADVSRLETGVEASWAGLIEPLERIHDRLGFSWGTVGHLMGVKNSDALRAAHEACQPDVVKLSMRLAQSEPLFRALEELRAGSEWDRLDAAQHRIVESLLRDARLSGVALEGEARERFNAIQLELAELSTRFSNHVLDATKAFAVTLTTPEEVAGLPQSLLELSAQGARQAGDEGATPEAGPWRITLDYPSFVPFLEHSRRRDLREQLYRAYVTRASEGELDNGPVLERTLELRSEAAGLLGYASFAEVSLATKMAPDVASVEQLLEELRSASYEAARRELDELAEFARENGADEATPLAHWDIAFWSERLREARFSYSEEELRPYFPLPVVLEGLFGLARQLFGVEIRAADGEAPVWHDDVRFFRAFADGVAIAAFYLDPYSRPAEKRGGAWMDECLGRTRLGGELRLPVAYLVCNGTPPVDGKPSLMTFSEAETLFHEFGHGLQHMLTSVDYGMASGIRNVEWDAVELPSQFMENWLYQRETVRSASAHVDSGEPLPDALIEKLRAARTYRAGSAMLRQLYFAFTDLELHHRYAGASDGRESGEGSAFDVQRRIAGRTTVLAPLPEDRFLCSFAHIFAGGYAAGYYSYKWAEVLSADAFAAFEEAGLDDAEAVSETGRRYRDTVLALGGSVPPMDVFVAFRGREPSTEALLRHSGLAP